MPPADARPPLPADRPAEPTRDEADDGPDAFDTVLLTPEQSDAFRALLTPPPVAPAPGNPPALTLPAYFETKDHDSAVIVARTVVLDNCQIAIDYNPDGQAVGVEVIGDNKAPPPGDDGEPIDVAFLESLGAREPHGVDESAPPTFTIPGSNFGVLVQSNRVRWHWCRGSRVIATFTTRGQFRRLLAVFAEGSP